MSCGQQRRRTQTRLCSQELKEGEGVGEEEWGERMRACTIVQEHGDALGGSGEQRAAVERRRDRQ